MSPSIATVLVFGVVLFSVMRRWRLSQPMLGLVMGWLVAVFFLGCLLPASFVRSRSIRIPPANERVEVLDRKRVGVYDTVTLASKDGGENVISLFRVR